MDGPTCIFWANLTPCWLQHWTRAEGGSGDRIEWCIATLRQLLQPPPSPPPLPTGGTKPLAKRQRGATPTQPAAAAAALVKLLDVGSCYDPFRQYTDLRVTAVDLCPSEAAARTVFKGDFLTG